MHSRSPEGSDLASRNPFCPTFGASPPVIAGRDDILDAIGDAFATGPTHPDYTTLFLGVRGAGKTVMLNAVEDLARARGWLAVSDDASHAGILGRLSRAAARLLDELEADPGRRIRSLTAAGFGVEFEPAASTGKAAPGAAEDLRSVLSALGDALADKDTGLIITLDELLGADIDEIRQFGSVMQHVCRREQRPIAFVGAALPQFQDVLESDNAATFMQRCSRYDIDRLDLDATRLAIAKPIEDRGASIQPAALDRAVTATSGYAFMVQLVGFHSWDAASEPPSEITADNVAVGIDKAQKRIGRLVLAPMWKELSDMDRRFLFAMAQDDGESRLADIAARLDVGTNYAGVYRRRLISAGMIVSTGRGRIDLSHHVARDWIRSKVAQEWRRDKVGPEDLESLEETLAVLGDSEAVEQPAEAHRASPSG